MNFPNSATSPIFRSPFPDLAMPPITLHDLILEKARAVPDKIALVDGPTGRSYTYGQIVASVERIAAAFAARGLAKGGVVALYSPNLPEYALAFFGVSMAGGVNTTVNPLYTAKELASQLRDSGAQFIITIGMFLANALEAVQGLNVEVTQIKEIFVIGEIDTAHASNPLVKPFAELLTNDGPPPAITFNPLEDLLAMPYSSGTTGLPKGVMLTHQNITCNIRQMTFLEQPTPDDVMIGVLPFFHIYGMTCIMAAMLYAQAQIVSMPRFDLQQFLELVQSHRATRAYLVPPIILGLAKHPMVDKYDFSSMKYITSGAAPMSEAIGHLCAERLKCVVKQGYGMTESSPVTTMNNPHVPIKLASVGPILPNTECKVISLEAQNGRRSELGVSETGELCFRGPQVMKGYLNRPDATAEAIDAEGWLHTGDVGYVDADGYVYIVDRFKEFIKYNAYQVAPAELEGILLGHPSVADAAVIPASDEESGEIPKAFIVKKADATLTADEVMSFVAERVAAYKKVRAVEFIEEIPKSASGKILRRVLIERERQKIA